MADGLYLPDVIQADGSGIDPFAANNASQANIAAAAGAIEKQDSGVVKTLLGDASLGVVDLADTVASSIPFASKSFGLERGDVNRAFLSKVGAPGLQDFYNDNKGGIEAASGIYGIIGSELVARRLTAPAGLAMRALKNVGWGRRIASLDMQYERAMKAVRFADESLAARGALGAEQFVGRVTLPAEGLLAGSRVAGKEASRKGLYWTARGLGALKGIRNAAATEAVMGVTLNQNGFLYHDDMSHNLMWGALGLGIGGAFESVAAGYAIRKNVNSDYMRRIYADALDPDMSEAARVGWHGKPVDASKFRGLRDIPEGQGFLAGSITDDVTNLLVGATSKSKTATADTVDGARLYANRDRLATQDLQLAREEIQKATMKGIEGDGFTRFGNKTANSSGHMNHLDMVMKRDPAAMYGIEEIGASRADQSAMITHLNRENRITNLIEDAQAKLDQYAETPPSTKAEMADFDSLQAKVRRYKWKQQFIPVPIIDGERATLSDLQALDGWVDPEVVRSKLVDDVPLWEIKTEHSGKRVALDRNGQIYLPGNPTADLSKTDHFDVMRLYRLGREMIADAAKDPKFQMALPENPNYFQLDMAEEILKKNPGAIITYPTGMTRESAQVESFAQKAEILQKESRKAKMKQVVEGKKGNEYDPAVEASKLRIRLNLPRLSAYERGMLGESEHPVEQLLRGAAEYGPDEIRNLGLTDLMKGASDMKRIGDFAPTAASDFKTLLGNSFTYGLDEAGAPIKPILAYSRPLNPHEWAPDYLAERMAAARLDVVSKLSEGNTFTSNLQKQLLASPDFDAASRTRELMETQVQGSTLGSNHLGPLGAAAKAVKARDWIGRDNPAMLAASRIQEMVQRLARDNFQKEARGLQTIASQLDSPRNTSSKLLLNQFVAYRPGWDLAVKNKRVLTAKGQVEASGKEVTQFILDATERNQKRWQEVFGEAMPEGAVLTAPNGRAVTLDDVGLKFMTEFNRMTESVRTNKNQLLSAQGLRNIDSMPMYVPPANLDGKFIGFTMDVEGNVVPGMTVIANTEAEFAAQQNKILKQIEDQGLKGYRFRTRDDIKQFADIWDRAQMDMIDPGTTAIQGGKESRGLLAAPTIDMKGVEGILNTLRSQYMNHAQDILTTNFKDQLRSAESRSNIATAMSRNAANPEADQKYRSIHDMYIENLTGRSPLRSKGSFIGGFYNWTEGKADQILGSMYPGFARTWSATSSFIDRAKIWQKGDGAKRDFESLTRHLGEYMPFESQAKFVEAQGGGMPPKLKDIMGSMNRFTAATMLRWFEPAMAVMNLTGMVNAMPSVIRHVQQQVGETAAEHAQRIGHLATIFEGAGKNGENIGVLNMGKLMASGFAKAWSKERHADFAYMARNGYLTQEVAEFQRQFGSIETKADWERFFFGSESGAAAAKAKGQNIRAAIQSKGIDGWMSVLTDKSEDFSRSWGHMVGLELAENLGIKGMEAKHNFAHDLANKMIANYNPSNRPEVFQGALGAPLGLFQSFILNYYQRMFRYVETKDLQSAAIQGAMQGALFGIPTIPGMSEVSKLFFHESGGDIDPVQSIQSRFGHSAGDILFGGVLSNIPKLFGAEGVDLYSRGDTAVRLPGLQPPPAFAVASKVFSGVTEAAQAMFGVRPALSTTQMAEILSNTIPNRPMAGMIEQAFADGNKVDSAGQIATDTRSTMESVYRMLGVRSMRQSKELEAFYSNKNQMSLQNSQMDMLRKATRTAFRSGDMDAVPRILEKYIEQGGDPRNARRWMKEQFDAATQTRGVRQLEQTIKSPDKMAYAVRLLDAGVSIDDDEQTPDEVESTHVDDSEFGQVNHEMMDYGLNNVATDPMLIGG